ncbi:hypothetical protein CEE37_08405 [candidate division LCP-89 bacterium B3_LCP]|uniref:DUF2178 domain-containing protein n=1 Tax=candidate division LCP-89 bacterium B3_LCP TaxID=2012998 RepID=A0A532UZJ1_UNCL8|nr:MAG: hypothetical protein CEE37_08405 [candidate division LCP-89 bacterium B3_LCP]
MTTLQKRALFGAIISGAILLATTTLLIITDPATIFEKDSLELAYLGFMLGGAVIYGILVIFTRRGKEGEDFVIDERDVFIARRALIVQLRTVLIALALWCVVLVRIYIGNGGIPVPLMYIMYIFILFLNLLARSICIYHGYNLPINDPERKDR